MCESVSSSSASSQQKQQQQQQQQNPFDSSVGYQQRFGGVRGSTKTKTTTTTTTTRMPGFKVLQVSKVQVPHYFRCPISLDLMRDPVTVATGQTYDRASIEKWVADGNATCPATMQRLHDLTLIPNHTLRRLIQEWCVANRARGVERIPTPKQPVDPRRIEELLRVVEPSTSNNTTAVAETIRGLRSMAKESDKNRAALAESGAARVMVAALCRAATDGDEGGDEVVEEAIALLALLPLGDEERRTLATGSMVATVSRVLSRGGSSESRIAAAAVVEKLAAGGDEGMRTRLGSTEGIMAGLVALLRDGGGSGGGGGGRAAKASVRALFSLCLCASAANCEAAVAAGAAAPLVEHLPGAASSDAERTLGALELLCRTRAGREAVGGHALAVPALVGAILRGASFQATECAAGTLLAICSASAAVQAAAVQCGVVAQLLLLIQSGCTERAKRKAMELLKLLRGAWADDPCLLAELERTDVAAF